MKLAKRTNCSKIIVLFLVFTFFSGCKQYDKIDRTVTEFFQENNKYLFEAANLLSSYKSNYSISIFTEDHNGIHAKGEIRSFNDFKVCTASDSPLSEEAYQILEKTLSPLFSSGKIDSIYWIEDFIFFVFKDEVGKDVNLLFYGNNAPLPEAYMITRSNKVSQNWYIVYTEG